MLKDIKKYNEITLTKKIDLNDRKITIIHPPPLTGESSQKPSRYAKKKYSARLQPTGNVLMHEFCHEHLRMRTVRMKQDRKIM